MAELTPELAEQLVTTCHEHAEAAAAAFGRAFEGEFVLKPGAAAPYDEGSLTGPGVVFAVKFAEESLLILLQAENDIVPEWVKSPDPTGEEKLSTLGQELSHLLVPEQLTAEVFEARWSDDLAEAIERAVPAENATTLAIEIAAGERLGTLQVLWPVADAMAAVVDNQDQPSTTATKSAAKPTSTVLRGSGYSPKDFRDLPPNTLSALQVHTEVSVNLATKKMKLGDIVELGPGSIITFDKSCDDPLEIAVGNRPIAQGEAVKVGDRFGVRVLTMVLPNEHFRPLLSSRTKQNRDSS